ncbi:hypothetical protein LO771_26480 [Streptacidiphilus sp. ASG 303]|uniref:hypothetical protein n=1 Tax=Streptacidiphilus sp. ASG 303 TaxID=2896847 RepID=UPI001E2DA1DA|nr:hypothetical protein [Streptacidiphilus sp. ASG 303]MCD0485840.1 hypothetical protein [Streptacidiphilus sp. ASG 303]
MQPDSTGWKAVIQITASEVLNGMRDAGRVELRDSIIRFLRALAIEVGTTVTSGHPPPGLPMTIRGVTWYSVHVFNDPVFFNYSIYPEERQIRICDLIWVEAL